MKKFQVFYLKTAVFQCCAEIMAEDETEAVNKFWDDDIMEVEEEIGNVEHDIEFVEEVELKSK